MARPQITLKIASSLDGKIALQNGLSEWITGAAAREHGRRLRSQYDAIAVGANTALIDNPQLTTRISGLNNPVRVIFDTAARLSPQSNLALTARDVPVYLMTAQKTKETDVLAALGVIIIETGVDDTAHVNLIRALDLLHRQGIRSLLLEGGGTLAASFIKAGVIDIIEWYRASMILGGDGRSAISALGLSDMLSVYRFNRVSVTELEDDMHERYERVKAA
jgi:diaminohydroxyphosphoribosylaminopyrimidine deaminase/5-amino-6-(5-phosphoribosylamino)uracil reductase